MNTMMNTMMNTIMKKGLFIALFVFPHIGVAQMSSPIVNRISKKFRWVEVASRSGAELALGEVLTANIIGGFICDLIIYKQLRVNYYYADSSTCPYIDKLKIGQILKRFQVMKKVDYIALLAEREKRRKISRKPLKVIANKTNHGDLPDKQKLQNKKKSIIFPANIMLGYFPKHRQINFIAEASYNKHLYSESSIINSKINHAEYATAQMNTDLKVVRGIKGRFSIAIGAKITAYEKKEQKVKKLNGFHVILDLDESNKGLNEVYMELARRIFKSSKYKFLFDSFIFFSPKLGTARRSNNFINPNDKDLDVTQDGNSYSGRNTLIMGMSFIKELSSAKELKVEMGLMLNGKREEIMLKGGEKESGKADDFLFTTNAKFDFYGELSYQFKTFEKYFLELILGGRIITQEISQYSTHVSGKLNLIKVKRDGYLLPYIGTRMKFPLSDISFLAVGLAAAMTNNYQYKTTFNETNTSDFTTHNVDDNFFYGVTIGYNLFF